MISWVAPLLLLWAIPLIYAGHANAGTPYDYLIQYQVDDSPNENYILGFNRDREPVDVYRVETKPDGNIERTAIAVLEQWSNKLSPPALRLKLDNGDTLILPSGGITSTQMFPHTGPTLLHPDRASQSLTRINKIGPKQLTALGLDDLVEKQKPKVRSPEEKSPPIPKLNSNTKLLLAWPIACGSSSGITESMNAAAAAGVAFFELLGPQGFCGPAFVLIEESSVSAFTKHVKAAALITSATGISEGHEPPLPRGQSARVAEIKRRLVHKIGSTYLALWNRLAEDVGYGDDDTIQQRVMSHPAARMLLEPIYVAAMDLLNELVKINTDASKMALLELADNTGGAGKAVLAAHPEFAEAAAKLWLERQTASVMPNGNLHSPNASKTRKKNRRRANRDQVTFGQNSVRFRILEPFEHDDRSNRQSTIPGIRFVLGLPSSDQSLFQEFVHSVMVCDQQSQNQLALGMEYLRNRGFTLSLKYVMKTIYNRQIPDADLQAISERTWINDTLSETDYELLKQSAILKDAQPTAFPPRSSLENDLLTWKNSPLPDAVARDYEYEINFEDPNTVGKSLTTPKEMTEVLSAVTFDRYDSEGIYAFAIPAGFSAVRQHSVVTKILTELLKHSEYTLQNPTTMIQLERARLELGFSVSKLRRGTGYTDLLRAVIDLNQVTTRRLWITIAGTLQGSTQCGENYGSLPERASTPDQTL